MQKLISMKIVCILYTHKAHLRSSPHPLLHTRWEDNVINTENATFVLLIEQSMPFRTSNALYEDFNMVSVNASYVIIEFAVRIEAVQLLAPDLHQTVPSAAAVLHIFLGGSRMLIGACVFWHLLNVVLVT